MESQRANERESMAEYFDRLFGPVLSSPWAARLVDIARLVPGEHVLDVACGSGAVAAAARERVGLEGAVTGLDPNPDMLAVARRKHPDLRWCEGRAEALPFEDEAFDAVLCQFGVMFFDDPVRALTEMRRVLRPAGRIALAVWDRLNKTPAYTALIGIVERHLSLQAAEPCCVQARRPGSDQLAAAPGRLHLRQRSLCGCSGEVSPSFRTGSTRSSRAGSEPTWIRTPTPRSWPTPPEPSVPTNSPMDLLTSLCPLWSVLP